MTPDPAVSVIISTRNRAHYLPEVLGSVARQQTSVSFEVIVIDNASTDGTASWLDTWSRRDARFRWGQEPRPGLSRGKNAGVRLARAPLLLFTDDDVRVDPGWIEAYHRTYSRLGTPLTLYGGPIVPMPHDLGPWPSWLAEPALVDAGLLHHREDRELRRGEFVWGGNMGVPRTVFDRLGLWSESAGLQGDARVTGDDTRAFEDTELQERARDAGGGVWFCPAAVVHHRVDRRTVTPRRVVSFAFDRGRRELWVQERRRWGDMRQIPRRPLAPALLALAWRVLTWAAWTAVFRLARGQRVFDGARLAARASGAALDGLALGRETQRVFRAAARLVFGARGLLLRATADVP